MPQSPSYRRDLESQKLLLKQELYRLYGSDYSQMKCVRETLTRLETRRGDIGYSDQDHADPSKARDILDRAKAIAAFYNPSQPRDAHGRWTSLDVQDTIAHLENAVKEHPHTSQKLCATYVREAIAAGGIDFDKKDRPPSGSAKDYGPTLEKYGFDAVPNTNGHQDYPPNGYTPQAGDVVVIQSTSTSPDGHMAMYSGKQWISDFKQPDFWPNKTYADKKPSYVIYRHKNK